MRIDILTLFPKMFENVLNESMLKIARKKKKTDIRVHNLRDWTCDRHKTADDKPYGGGSGMILKIEPLYKALADLLGENRVKKAATKKGIKKNMKIILLTPKGKKFNQKIAKKLSKLKHIILICGHYEGIDERIRSLVTDELSIGDYIMTGGEIPAMAVLDAVTRLIPGVLGDRASLRCESFENNLLEYPQYTRPREFEGMRVPEVLLSGNHKAIDAWRRKESLKRTKKVRSDLLWKR
ncbi:MAG: tRNA (guanosine(37)-N1)-methyltransferase TrmD [Candidatus Omnitrophota bacterium]|nr:MAG: tRNA (guanosine(37)-N1)-methyltransferase TrmD [Candidatus Omnitrophota bacterium]